MNFYDDGYKSCDCYWGQGPAKFVEQAVNILTKEHSPETIRAIDLGCGEGKNTKYIAEANINVIGVDVSEFGIRNARKQSEKRNTIFLIGDMRLIDALESDFHLVVSTGSIHCLPTKDDVSTMIKKIKKITKPGGLVVISSFNNRSHDFSGHGDGFNPILLPHDFYLDSFNDLQILDATDQDLSDIHPDNNIKHQHSVTRILARKY